MKGKIVTYNFFALLYKLRFVVSFFFLFLLIAKPLLYSSFQDNDMYELIDTTENENASKKKNTSDIEIETIFYSKIDLFSPLESKLTLLYIDKEPFFLKLNIEVYLRPPRV